MTADKMPPHVEITCHPEGYKVSIYLRSEDVAEFSRSGQLEVTPDDDGDSAPTLHVADLPANPGEHKLARFRINI